MTVELDHENTIRGLKGDPMVKVCVECKFHLETNRCHRDRKMAFHNVTGKQEIQGAIHSCNIEREINDQYEGLVLNKKCCGAIGQFWVQKEKKEKKKPRWWMGWLK